MFSLSESVLMCGMSAFQVWGTLCKSPPSSKADEITSSCSEILQRAESTSSGMRGSHLRLDWVLHQKLFTANRSLLYYRSLAQSGAVESRIYANCFSAQWRGLSRGQ